MLAPSRYVDIPFVDLCSWVLDNPSYDAHKAIYIDAHDESQSLSHHQCISYIRKTIAGLQALGVQPGDSVCLHSFNNIWYSVLFLAIIGAQGTVVGSNPAYTQYELEHLFNITQTKYLVVHPEQLDRVWSAAEACDIPQENVLVFDVAGEVVDGFDSWRSLHNHGESDWYRFDDEEKAKTTPAMLASTSGTTGLPKAAIVPHHSFVAVSKQAEDSKDKPYQVRRLLCLPQFHLFPAHLIHVAPLQEGHTTYVMRRWDLSQYTEFVERFEITETAITTPIVLALLGLSDTVQKRLQSLRYVQSAGAPLGHAEQNALRNRCNPEATVTQVWGLTEIGWVTKFDYPEDDYTGSVGRMMPSNEAKIVDRDGNEMTGPDAVGQILVRGPGIMVGYRNNPEATKAMVIDGWLHTGDVGYQKDGKWYVVDRVKDLIKVRGWQVSPSEIEQNLLLHPAICDAAVVGVDFKDGRGELPKGYIVLRTPRTPVDEQEILDFMSERLAKYKTLAGGIEEVAFIPRNPSGKILKRILRDRAMRKVETLGPASPPAQPSYSEAALGAYAAPAIVSIQNSAKCQDGAVKEADLVRIDVTAIEDQVVASH